MNHLPPCDHDECGKTGCRKEDMADPDIDGIVDRHSKLYDSSATNWVLSTSIREALTEYDTLMRRRIRDECLADTENIYQEAHIAQGRELELRGKRMAELDEQLLKMTEERDALLVEAEGLVEALESYATCCDGCTCGDGWSHDTASKALARWRAAHPKT